MRIATFICPSLLAALRIECSTMPPYRSRGYVLRSEELLLFACTGVVVSRPYPMLGQGRPKELDAREATPSNHRCEEENRCCVFHGLHYTDPDMLR